MATMAAAMEMPSAPDNAAPRTTAPSPTIPLDAALPVQPPRLFIVCGRDRKAEELREMFARCGPIRHLHVATDRSNKSRGFAFLQYDDASCATEAIKQFDQMTLSDGHILKVTVARDKTSSTAAETHKPQVPGKLKRNQHSQEDSDEKGDDGSTTDGGSFPGKRQRSSPPLAVVAPGIHKAWKRVSPFKETPIVKPLKVTQVVRSVEEEVADVLSVIITQIERLHTPDEAESLEKPVANGSAAAKRKAPTTTAFVSSERAASGGALASALSSSAQTDCETLQPANQKSQRTTASQATPNRHQSRHHGFLLRQRRQRSMDESDSSVDDASDASIGRRKRSNTEPDDGDAERPRSDTEPSVRRRLSDLSELSLSPAGISSPTLTSKKRCSRRSSASSSSSSVPHFQTVAYRNLPPLFIPAPPRLPPHPVQRHRAAAKCKLFFTSTYKFTEQELEAMFSVYDEFEAVQLSKSFGRVKTMAYVSYTTAAAASSVLVSFLEDNEGEDHGSMKLVYADSNPPVAPFTFPVVSAVPSSSAGESTSSEVPLAVVDSEPDSTPLTEGDRCWLMLLYDRGLTNEAISSRVTECEGMEFVDIKVIRSTGESQGVAFVKFQAEEHAEAASQRLHNTEYPVGSRKYLQAIVIADPSLFSTPHGASQVSAATAHEAAPSSVARPRREDGDLGVVEARFAHLMSGASENTAFTTSGPNHDPRFASSGPIGANPFIQSEFQPTQATPSYGYFHFGQPYPYASPPPPPLPPHHRSQQHAGFYPPQQAWGYEELYPMWPEVGGSPMQPDFSQYSWGTATEFIPFGQNSGVSASASAPVESSSVVISSSRPIDLSALMAAIQGCSGVVGFRKAERDGNAFIVDFSEPHHATEAASTLDGTMCSGQKLRVAIAVGHRAFPSRRKRQRLDQRGRRK